MNDFKILAMPESPVAMLTRGESDTRIKLSLGRCTVHLALSCHIHPAKPQQAYQQQKNCAWFRDTVRRIPEIIGGGQYSDIADNSILGVAVALAGLCADTVLFFDQGSRSVRISLLPTDRARPVRAAIDIADAGHGQRQPIVIVLTGWGSSAGQHTSDAHHRIALVQPFQLLFRPGLTHFNGRAYHGQRLRLPKGKRRVAIEIAEYQWLGKRPGMGDDGRRGNRRAINTEQVIIGPRYSRHN